MRFCAPDRLVGALFGAKLHCLFNVLGLGSEEEIAEAKKTTEHCPQHGKGVPERESGQSDAQGDVNRPTVIRIHEAELTADDGSPVATVDDCPEGRG